jgi:Arc/MetJ family transcription regulator
MLGVHKTNGGYCRVAAPNPHLHVGCLTDTSIRAILICMKTTLNIDDAILEKASRLTGVSEKTALVRMGLEALVARCSAQRLAVLGGSEPDAKAAPRRRSA